MWRGITIDARAVLARDAVKRPAGAGQGNGQRGGNRGKASKPEVELDGELRLDLERETEMVFSEIIHKDRSVLELIDSDYTYLNQKLATVYGLTNLGVMGNEMRRITLPPDCPRGGVLTDGSVLVVTSNPDRTSPVKRGLFVAEQHFCQSCRRRRRRPTCTGVGNVGEKTFMIMSQPCARR